MRAGSITQYSNTTHASTTQQSSKCNALLNTINEIALVALQLIALSIWMCAGCCAGFMLGVSFQAVIIPMSICGVLYGSTLFYYYTQVSRISELPNLLEEKLIHLEKKVSRFDKLYEEMKKAGDIVISSTDIDLTRLLGLLEELQTEYHALDDVLEKLSIAGIDNGVSAATRTIQNLTLNQNYGTDLDHAIAEFKKAIQRKETSQKADASQATQKAQVSEETSVADTSRPGIRRERPFSMKGTVRRVLLVSLSLCMTGGVIGPTIKTTMMMGSLSLIPSLLLFSMPILLVFPARPYLEYNLSAEGIICIGRMKEFDARSFLCKVYLEKTIYTCKVLLLKWILSQSDRAITLSQGIIALNEEINGLGVRRQRRWRVDDNGMAGSIGRQRQLGWRVPSPADDSLMAASIASQRQPDGGSHRLSTTRGWRLFRPINLI